MNITKKRIILLFFILILCALAINPAKADDQTYQEFRSFSFTYEQPAPDSYDPDEVARYTVLILDVSGSMEGVPMTQMKKAAKKFCEEMLKAEGHNYIALVSYSGSNIMETNFTSSYENLERAIDSMTIIWTGTNIEGGMIGAKKIMNSVSYKEENRINNIVVMTDGMPNSGTMQGFGVFTYADTEKISAEQGSDLYRYANGIVSYAENYLWKDANVYGFGFFHSLTTDEFIFGEKLIKALQNAGAYTVTDPDLLEFEFGSLAHDVIEGSNDYPVIIVPGIMGSNLYTAEEPFGTKVWAASTSKLMEFAKNYPTHFLYFLNKSRLGINPTLIEDLNLVKNDIDLLFEGLSEKGLLPLLFTWAVDMNMFPELYGHNNYVNLQEIDDLYDFDLDADDTYLNLVREICEKFPKRQVYFFSYDFRQSNADTGDKLYKYIQWVIKESGKKKVDIVAHSMGGLVVSSMISRQGFIINDIDKIITCGTPYEGSPALVDRALTDKTIDKPVPDTALYLFGLSKDIKQRFPSLAELAPTEQYNANKSVLWKSVKYEQTMCPMQKSDLTSRNGRNIKFETVYTKNYTGLTQIAFKHVMDSVFGRNNEKAIEFHKDIKGNKENNLLAYLDNTYFIVGKNQKTIKDAVFIQVKDTKDFTIFKNCIEYNENYRKNNNNVLPIFGVNSNPGFMQDIKQSDGRILLNDFNYKLVKTIYDNLSAFQDVVLIDDLNYVAKNMGDGTVPMYSATMASGLDNIGRDAKGIERLLELSVDHGGTIKDSKAIDHIISILSSTKDDITSDDNMSSRFIKVRIACPVEVYVEHNGEILNSVPGNMTLNNSFGRLDFAGINGDIKLLCLDDETYVIQLQGTDYDVMDLTIEWYDENGNLVTEKQFLQIPVSPTTKMTVETNKDDVTILKVDHDGNGSVDDEWYAENGEIGYTIQQNNHQENHQVGRRMEFFRMFDDLKVETLPHTGFSVIHQQTVPAKPLSVVYKPLNWSLEIPSLSIFADIVEVPFVDGEYPITWLGSSVGLLEGSNKPGEGITVLTGHNHLNTTESGPFANLSSVEEGERIFVHDARGGMKIYTVYANEKVSENDFSAVEKIAAMFENSITMITCEDERIEGGYVNRRIVAAKLLK